MTYSLSNNCTKNYYNRTLTVQVIVEDVVTWIFLKHSVEYRFENSIHHGKIAFITAEYCVCCVKYSLIIIAFEFNVMLL